MKTIINRMRWLYTGVWLGVAFMIWLKGEESKTTKKPYTPSDQFNDIYNHYKEKENANA